MTTRAEEYRAFSVHLLTASGALLAFFAILAAAEGRFVAMFLWLGLALVVDGVDGPLARRFEVVKVLPNWSGDTLDAVIDYATYVIIPAFALYQAGIVGPGYSYVAAALIVVTSAIYYADKRMKTKDNHFRGFPVVWNMVVFVLFAVQPGTLVSLLVVAFCAATTFLPIKFLHPVRVVRFRPFNLAVSAVWGVLGLVSLAASFEPPSIVTMGIVVTSLYLLLVGPILQVIDRTTGHRSADMDVLS